MLLQGGFAACPLADEQDACMSRQVTENIEMGQRRHVASGKRHELVGILVHEQRPSFFRFGLEQPHLRTTICRRGRLALVLFSGPSMQHLGISPRNVVAWSWQTLSRTVPYLISWPTHVPLSKPGTPEYQTS